MRKLAFRLCAAVFLLCGPFLHATIFGKIQGVVHDPQHRPVAAATVVLKSSTSAWSQTTQTDRDGAFNFSAVPIGDYVVTVTQSGFDSSQQTADFTITTRTKYSLNCAGDFTTEAQFPYDGYVQCSESAESLEAS
jgi:hypothetical protein